MANAHSRRHVDRNKGRARHRAKKRTPEVYTWLGAGAVSVGIGVAIVSGASAASADTGTDDTSTNATQATAEQSANDSSGQQPSSPTDTQPVSTFGSGRLDGPAAKSEKTVSSTAPPAVPDRPPVTSISASGGNVKTEISSGSVSTETSNNSVSTETSNNRAGGISPEPKIETQLTRTDETDGQQGSTGLQSLAVAVSASTAVDPAKDVTSSPVDVAPVLVEPTGTELQNATAHLQSLAPEADLPTSPGSQARSAADSSTAAATNVQEIVDVDPTGQFFTPASDDYAWYDAHYTSYYSSFAEALATHGTEGFTRDSTGRLSYTNRYSYDVAVEYTDTFDESRWAIRLSPTSRFVVVRPGQTVVIAGNYARAQGPRALRPPNLNMFPVGYAEPGKPSIPISTLPKNLGGWIQVGLSVGGILDGITGALDRIPTVWNLAVGFRIASFITGANDLVGGIATGNGVRIGNGVVDIASALLPKQASLAIDIAKAAIAVVLPLNGDDQTKFLDFRAKCMFGKGSDQLSPSQAQAIVDRYTGLAGIANVPGDYARYNVGGWFGSPSC